MAEEIVMPRMSDTMEKGTVVRWLKQEGQEVKKGEPLAEIETDKATMQLESYASGVLQRILLPEGESAPIGMPIAVIGAPSEARAERAAAPAPAAAPPTAAVPPTAAPPARPAVPEEAPARVLASPIAKRLAEELGIDLATVTGTGPGGRITREDVESVAAARRVVPPPAPVAPPPAPAAPAAAAIERPVTRMQETIARRMVQSKTTIPHFYVTTEVDMAAAARLREQLNQAWTGLRVSFSDLIVKAAGLALRAYPLVNASWRDDHIVYHGDVNVGYAVAMEGGLLVPVLHDVDKTDLRTISRKLKELVQRTREGKAMAGDFDGGTFTISNLGQYPVEEFFAIVNPPESGILAVGRIEKKPVVRDDHIVISDRLHLSLSGDHRVFYGATGGEFLGELKRLLENPLSLLA